MNNFTAARDAIQQNIERLSKNTLFSVDFDGNELWDLYLKSFPEGSNPIFRERTEHNCSCCKQFIRNYGGMVGIEDNNLVTIWDVEVEDPYAVVFKKMSEFILTKLISNIFLTDSTVLGTKTNFELTEDKRRLTWDHFYGKVAPKFVKSKALIGGLLSEARTNKEVFERGLKEITIDAADTVLDLIDQNSLYRGEEFKNLVVEFRKHKVYYDTLGDNKKKDNYCWETSYKLGGISKIRGTVIGTLLLDISEGVDLDKAVQSYEAKVAPTNYKRPTALISKRMIEDAQATIKDLGIEDSLYRRFATDSDLSINNVLFANRTVIKSSGVFDELANSLVITPKTFSKIEEVTIEDFINNILPRVSSVEVLVENRHKSNLMSLYAPQYCNSQNLFKWGNAISWGYAGGVADSIKERVKAAGGNVHGALRCSLSWFNYDDLDLHAQTPAGRIYFANKQVAGGRLDVDMNAGGAKSRSAVENIVWANKNDLRQGDYVFSVNNYCKREPIDIGFDIEIEFGDTTTKLQYRKPVSGTVDVAKVSYSIKDGFKLTPLIPSVDTKENIWGITTHQFTKVKMILNSPNHWDGECVGNKHYFFILEGCKNDNSGRAFFNEFLRADLEKHRKVFEVLGSKMKIEMSDQQLSGVGFSSTQRNSLIVKVTGNFTRTLKITF